MTAHVSFDADGLMGSFRVWFTLENIGLLFNTEDRRWIELLTHAVLRIAEEQVNGAAPLFAGCEDAVDAVNALYPFLQKKELSVRLDECLAEMMIQRRFFVCMNNHTVSTVDDLDYWFFHARQIVESVPGLLCAWIAAQPAIVQQRLHPALRRLTVMPSVFSAETSLQDELSAFIVHHDPFAGGGAFRVRNGEFMPAVLDTIPVPDAFFGFFSLRAQISSFFRDFVTGKSNVPLLMTGLPGLGKTHLTLSHALANRDLTLIIADPATLESGFETLLLRLSARPYRKFAVFFDDVDPRKIDWYAFRTHVGGSFSLPDHVTLMISSNYIFPANIISRGKLLLFPLFDHHRCMEMVFDFLKSTGMKKPPENLVSVIAADYTEACGQKIYDDVSPRTLMRHLELYRQQPEKRMRMLEYANSDVISRPDPDLFFDANLKRLRALHGEAAIDDLRHQMMKDYGL